MSKSANADIKNMNFEEALSELESIVNTIETGKVNLDETIQYYTRGALLKAHCESKLKKASLEIEKIITDENNVSAS